MPQIESLPAQQSTPESIIAGNLKSVQDYYTGQEQELKSQMLTHTDFRRSIYNLQSAYDRDKVQVQTQQQRLKVIDQLVKEGKINADFGSEAKWRTVLPEDTQAAMFPRVKESKPPEKPGAPFSPTSMGGYEMSIDESLQNAKSFGGNKLSEEQTTPSALQLQYVLNRKQNGYEGMNTTEKHQFDYLWDEKAKTRGFTNWNPGDPQIRLLRGVGPLQQTAARQVNPLVKSEVRSPLAQSVVTEKRPQTLTKEIAQQFLTQAGGDKDKARQIAKQQGYSF
jgi:hypothetical protein